MIVVDASVVIETLLRSAIAPSVEERIFAPGETLHAPHVLDLEVAQVLRRFATTRQMKPERCAIALRYLADFPLTRYAHDFLLTRIWELRSNMTAYDAAYVALAEALDAPLLTRDKRLASAPGHLAQIEIV